MESVISHSHPHSHLQSHSMPSSNHSTPGAVGTPSSAASPIGPHSPHGNPNLHSLSSNSSSSLQQPQANQPFALEAFDFSSQDFTLPSNLDELNLFTHQNSPRNHHATAAAADSPSSQSNPNSAQQQQVRLDDMSSQQLQAIIQSAVASANNSNSPSASHPNQPTPAHPPHSNLKINTSPNQQGAPIGHLTIQDLHRILVEKEQSERMQNMQTAVLRQQLETLQQMSKQQLENSSNHSFMNQHGGHQPHQTQQSTFLPFFGSKGGNGHHSSGSTAGGTHHSSSKHHPQAQNKSSPSSSSSSSLYPTHASVHGLPIPSSATPASVVAQYGLMTPMGSGAFGNSVFNDGQHHPNGQTGHQPFVSPLDMPHGHGNEIDGQHMKHQPWRGQEHESAFSPLESPAMTPASVFSNMSRGGGAEHLFFSPLTSPALRPQPPSAGEMMLSQAHLSQDGSQSHHHYDAPLPSPQFRGQGGQSTTPAASPLALMGRPGPSSSTRRNRSSTAEAKANKIRPSPLVKPQTGRGKKRNSSGMPSPNTSINQASSTSDSRRQSFGEASSSGNTDCSRSRSGSRTTQHQPQTSISAFSSNFDSNTRMDASPSEGAVSTPSPIDLSGSSIMPPPAAPSNKPMTPGSIMGIGSSSGSGGGNATRQSSNLVPSSSTGTTRSTRAKTSASSSTNGASTSASASVIPQPILKKPAIYTGGPAGPRAQAGGGRGRRAAKAAAAAVNFANPGMTPAERETWLNKMAGTDGDSRKTSHKAAEQKRRDSLKYCFDELRTLLPAIILDENSPGGSALGADGLEVDQQPESFQMEDTLDKVPGSEAARTANKGISKVALLRHSNEYIIRLKMRLNRRDQDLESYRRKMRALKKELGRDEDDEDNDLVDGEEEDSGGGEDDGEQLEDARGQDQMNMQFGDSGGLSLDHGRDLGFDMDVS